MGFNPVKFVSNAVGDFVDSITGAGAKKAYKKHVKPVANFYGSFRDDYLKYFKELSNLYENPIGINTHKADWIDLLKPFTPSGLISDIIRRNLIASEIANQTIKNQQKLTALSNLTKLSENAVANWAKAQGAMADVSAGVDIGVTGALYELIGKLLPKVIGG